MGGEGGGVAPGTRKQAGEQVFGEQTRVFGEQAKEQADEEVGDLRRVFPPFAEPFGEPGELAGGLFRDLGGGFGRTQPGGVVEHRVEQGELGGVEQVVERQFVHPFDRVGKVGVDADELGVGHHEQGRVLQALPVLQELVIRPVEVGVFAFIFPGEKVLFPDIGEPPAGSRFERETAPGFIRFRGGAVPDQFTHVQEVLLVKRAFFELHGAPFVDEGLRGHCPSFWLPLSYLGAGAGG